MNKQLAVDQVTNGAKSIIAVGEPYIAQVTIEGSADLLFHRWNVDGVEAKGKAAKGSKAKKSDDVESYVYRNDKGEIALPGEYLRQSILGAARFRQDPRSPRKSALDLFKAGIVSLTELSSFGAKKWDYEDRRRVMIQRNGVTRVRPAMRAGWRLTFEFQIILAEYIDPITFRQSIEEAGRLIGIADFRPTYGRFGITSYAVR